MQALVQKLLRNRFVRNTMAERADLTAFRQRPTPRVVAGVSAIALSYLIGWPLIAVLTSLAVYFDVPLLAVLGGPAAYILSHLTFLLGMYLAGARYSWIFLRWLTRMAVLKLTKRFPPPERSKACPADQAGSGP